MRLGARSCATPARPWSLSPIATRSFAESCPGADAAERMRLDTAISRLKLELGVTADEVAADPDAGPDGPGLRRLRARRRRDRRPRLRRPRPARDRRLSTDEPAPRPLARRAAASCSSTRSRTSTGRSSGSPCCSRRPPTGSSSSATTTRASMAGGSPTSAACSASPPSLPGLRRVDLEVNYRCRRRSSSARSGSSSTTASGSRSGSGPGREQRAARACAGCGSDETVRAPARARVPGRTTDRRGRSWRGPTASCCRPSPWPSSLDWPFRAPRIELPVESPLVDEALEQLARSARAGTRCWS